MKRIFIYLGNNTPDYRSLMKAQKDLVLNGRKIPLEALVIVEQTHSDQIHHCTGEDSGAGTRGKAQIPVADGLISDLPISIFWFVLQICTPVLIYDETNFTVVLCIVDGRAPGKTSPARPSAQ